MQRELPPASLLDPIEASKQNPVLLENRAETTATQVFMRPFARPQGEPGDDRTGDENDIGDIAVTNVICQRTVF